VVEGTEESGDNDDEAGRVLVVDDVPEVREVVAAASPEPATTFR